MKHLFKLIVLLPLVFFTGCNEDAEIGNIIGTQITGNANDGDSTTPSDRYGPAGNDRDATDSKTMASSANAKFNELSGKAKAETLNPGGPTITDDEARGASFNKVVSQFIVKKAGAFTFNITLNVKKVELVGKGKMNITVQANILNNDGTGYPNGGITNLSFEFKKNQQGTVDVVIAGDTSSPEHPQSNGDYNRSLRGPNSGISLNPGNYRLEFDLRIIATAPTAKDANNNTQLASVENVTAKIELR